jgi:hypothetical protein
MNDGIATFASGRPRAALGFIFAALTLPFALWACSSHPFAQVPPAPEQQTDLHYDVNPARKLDIVFMIDDSSSMKDKQENLRRNFPVFMQKVLNIQGGQPDLHIAIISSNLGAGITQGIPGCPAGGDRGRFQVRPECGIDTNKAGHFLTVSPNGKTNFEAQGGLAHLPELFQCMAFLGDKGCGYEHQLLSLYFALDGKTNPENAGFLRDDAYLAVVMLTDEDDCSAEPGADFFTGTVAGQSGSLRCSLRGHVCGGQPVPAMPFSAPLATCEPYLRDDASEKNSRLVNVPFFVDFLKGLKNGRTDRILISEIVGWTADPDARYTLALAPASDNGPLALDTGKICQDDVPAADGGAGGATPALRLHQFANAFPNHTIFPICKHDLSPAMDEIGASVVTLLTKTCIVDPLVDADSTANGLQPDCQVEDLVPVPPGNSTYRGQPVPACSSGRGMPCWDLVADPSCSGGYKVDVRRSEPAPTGTVQSIECSTCAAGSTDAGCAR